MNHGMPAVPPNTRVLPGSEQLAALSKQLHAWIIGSAPAHNHALAFTPAIPEIHSGASLLWHGMQLPNTSTTPTLVEIRALFTPSHDANHGPQKGHSRDEQSCVARH